MINIRIEEEDLLDMLIDRLKFWTDDYITIALYEDYYNKAIECGCFDGRDINIMSIVDNDYVNWFDVITDEDFENYHVESDEDERIEARYDDGDTVYYLINCC